ncbi:MAG: hypothetical protein NTV42_09975 [Chloroflexi bacterium]|nr:hypothetical protein [Chloroflexota bacterium]
MRFLPLLPEAQNDYKGYKGVVVAVVLLAIVSTIRSLIHIFLPDGGSNAIAGLVIPGDANCAVIFTFAWTGLYQLLFAIILWIVLIRYRALIPLMILLLFFEELGLLLIPMFKPIASSLLTRTPPEAIGNKVLLPLILILFFVSLIPAPEHKSKAA